MLVQEQVQTKSFLNGSFAPSEAQEIVNSVVKQYRNCYNLQYMTSWEGNHDFDSSEIDKKIEALQMLQTELNGIIRKAKEAGTRVDVEALSKLSIQ
jgi:hypothetical protein